MTTTDFIESYDGALSPEICQRYIATFEASPYRTQGRTGGGVDESKKRSTDLYLYQHTEYAELLSHSQLAIAQCAERYFEKYFFALIAPLALTVVHPRTREPVALTPENWDEVGKPQVGTLMRTLFRMGPIQMQKYDAGSGNYNYWHCEVYPESDGNEALHRCVLFMFYLNDVAEGGETEFYFQQRALKPTAGQCVIAPAYFTHTHRGVTPRSCDKYILTSWILLQRAEVLYAPR